MLETIPNPTVANAVNESGQIAGDTPTGAFLVDGYLHSWGGYGGYGIDADIYVLNELNDAGFAVGSRRRYGLAGSSAILITPEFNAVTYLPTPMVVRPVRSTTRT